MRTYLTVLTTTDTKELAYKISNFLVENRLAACVQIIGPIESVYIWKEKVENSKEYLLLIKTHHELYLQVEESIKTLHTYDTPEIIALPIRYGYYKYKQWIDEVTKRNY